MKAKVSTATCVYLDSLSDLLVFQLTVSKRPNNNHIGTSPRDMVTKKPIVTKTRKGIDGVTQILSQTLSEMHRMDPVSWGFSSLIWGNILR